MRQRSREWFRCIQSSGDNNDIANNTTHNNDDINNDNNNDNNNDLDPSVFNCTYVM